MYIPKFNEEKDLSALHAFIESNPLGTWTAMADDDIVANHIPFLLHKDKGEYGTLVGHVSRGNDIWQKFANDKDSLVIFQGDQSYMSPNWYPSKHEHGMGVPTWCYMVAHARGIPSKHEEPEWLLNHVSELSDTHESRQSLPWKVSDAPEEFIEKLLGGIVGIEMEITELKGKWKLDQNRSDSDKSGVIAGLQSTGAPQSLGIAEQIARQLASGGKD